jgi:hypothetical protein
MLGLLSCYVLSEQKWFWTPAIKEMKFTTQKGFKVQAPQQLTVELQAARI